MHALSRYPRHRRRAVARIWAQRSNAVQAAARAVRGIDAETARWRALDDARGQIIAHGCVYSADRATPWEIRRSLRGRVNQVDLFVCGRIFLTGSLRAARRSVRFNYILV